METHEVLSVTPKIIELNENESNDIYMSLTMCILTNQMNLNKLRFTDDYIDGIVANKDSFIGIPMVANRAKLEAGQYKSLTHELNKKTGQLNTDQIGSFVDFWKETEEDGTVKLMGAARVHKRYPNVCDAMIELFESGDLEFSCEVFVFGYESKDEATGERSVNYAYDDEINSLFGSCVVTYPAEPKSVASILVAAIEKDLKGGEDLSNTPNTEVFNKDVEIRYHGKIESASLKYTDVANQIYNILNPVNAKTNDRQYNYYICDLYTDFVIVEEWYDYQSLWKINYTITNDIVVLDAEDNWIEGYKGFIPKGVSVDDLISSAKSVEIEASNKINELNSKHEEVLKLTEEQIKELQDKHDNLAGKVEELNGLIVSQKEEIEGLKNKEIQLNENVASLVPYKEQVETAEKETKKATLTEKFAKILSEDAMKSEEVVKAIEELNEVKLNEIVVAEVAKEKTNKQHNKNTNVIVSSRQSEDLIPQDRRSRLYDAREE